MPPDPAHRDVFRGSLDVLVLAVLADGPAHGYALQKRLAQTTGHDLPAGSLYPLLHKLETAGLVEAQWDHATKRPRKRYTLTPAGRASLKRDATAWHSFIARLDAVILPALRRVANS